MSLNAVAKSKILAYLNKTSMSYLFYEGMVESIGKNNYKIKDFLDFFISSIKENLSKDKIPLKLTKKMVTSTTSMIDWYMEENNEFDSNLKNRINEIYIIYQNCLEKNPDLEDKELTEFIDELMVKVNSINSRSETNEQVLTDAETQIATLTERLAILEAQVAEKDNTINVMDNRNKDLSLKKRQKKFRIDKLEEEIAKLERELKDLNTTLKMYTAKNDELSKKCDAADKRLDNLKRRLSKSHEENIHLSRRASALIVDLEREQTHKRQLQEELKKNAK